MLRRRLDALQSHAHAVMNDAQGLVSTTDARLGLLVEAAMAALATAVDVLDEIRDGISGQIEIAGKTLPCKIHINLLEGDEKG